MRTRTKVYIAIPVVVVAAGVGGPFVYIHFIHGKQPAKLSLASTPAASGSASAAPVSVDPAPLDPAGAWTVASGSVAGYRVKEVLLGQSTDAVGRTSTITGGFTIAPASSGTAATVTVGSFSVDMTTVKSDSGQRDSQFNGRIMDTADYPTATFTLTGPAAIASVPADQQTVMVAVTGDLTLHGTKKSVTTTLTVKRDGQKLDVLGDIAIHFADYGVNNPSGGPATVGDDGTLELLLDLQKSA